MPTAAEYTTFTLTPFRLYVRWPWRWMTRSPVAVLVELPPVLGLLPPRDTAVPLPEVLAVSVAPLRLAFEFCWAVAELSAPPLAVVVVVVPAALPAVTRSSSAEVNRVGSPAWAAAEVKPKTANTAAVEIRMTFSVSEGGSAPPG
jgi:hypothetical protein